jgi:hypothetical protein
VDEELGRYEQTKRIVGSSSKADVFPTFGDRSKLNVLDF